MGFYRYLVRTFDTNPVVGISWIMGGIGLTLPLWVPQLRESMGYNVNGFTKKSHRKVAGVDYVFTDGEMENLQK